MKRSVTLISVAMAAIALGLAGCGSSKSSAASPSTTGNAQAAFDAYRQCMSQHGVNLPNTMGNGRFQGGQGGQGNRGDQNGMGDQNPPSSPVSRPSTTLPPGVSQQAYDSAQQACQSKLPARQNNPQRTQQFQPYLSCLKDHGVNVDPNGGAQALGSIDRNSDTFKAAQQTCQKLMPQRPSTTTTTASA